MKTINALVKTIVCLFLIQTLYVSCSPPTSPENNLENSSLQKKLVKLNNQDDGRPAQTINYQEMADLLVNYETTRKNLLKKELGHEDTHTNWIQLDSLKKYIAYVEKNATEKGIAITGINFMSAVYSNDTSIYNQKVNLQTLILMPTTMKGTYNRAAFDPLYSKNNEPAYLDSILEVYKDHAYSKLNDPSKITTYSVKSDTITPPPDDQESSGMNRTASIPPPFPDDNGDGDGDHGGGGD